MWQTVSGHTGIPKYADQRSAMSAKLFSGFPCVAARSLVMMRLASSRISDRVGISERRGWRWKERWRRGREDDGGSYRNGGLLDARLASHELRKVLVPVEFHNVTVVRH